MLSWKTKLTLYADVVGEILTQKIKLRKLGDVDAIGEDMAGKTCIITGPTRSVTTKKPKETLPGRSRGKKRLTGEDAKVG